MAKLLRRLHSFPCAITVFLLLCILSPQSALAATMSGQITEADRTTPITGISLALEDAQTFRVVANAMTDAQGLFTFSNIPDGQYNVRVLEDYSIKPFPFLLPSDFPPVEASTAATTPINLVLLRRVSSNVSISADAPFQPSYSAQYDSIAFYGYEDLSSATGTNYDIYYMREVQKPIKVIGDPSNDFDPHLSPDGQRIVFVSDRDGNLNLYLVNVDGTNLTQLTSDPRDEFNPRWSPDGKHIAFNITINDGNGGLSNNLFVIDPDGANFDELTTSAASEFDFQWSPDSSQIVVASNRIANASHDYDLYLIDVASTQNTPLVTDDSDEFDPIWSPDGDSIFFSSYRLNDALAPQEFDYSSQGSTPVLRSQGTVAPDTMPNLLQAPSNINIWKYDLSTTQETQVTSHVSGSYSALYPRFHRLQCWHRLGFL